MKHPLDQGRSGGHVYLENFRNYVSYRLWYFRRPGNNHAATLLPKSLLFHNDYFIFRTQQPLRQIILRKRQAKLSSTKGKRIKKCNFAITQKNNLTLLICVDYNHNLLKNFILKKDTTLFNMYMWQLTNLFIKKQKKILVFKIHFIFVHSSSEYISCQQLFFY